MENTRTKNTIRNILFGVLNKIVTLIFPFIIRTILIKKLGAEYLGLGSLFTSILQVLNLTELGFSSAIVFSMYKPIAEKDTDTICALMNLYKKIYRIIGCIILTFGLAITPFIHNLIKGSYPDNINIYILFIIYLINTVITYILFAYKGALLQAHQRRDIFDKIHTVLDIIQYTLQIIVLCVFKNYYAYIIITTIINIIKNLSIAYITNKKYPEYICKGKVPAEQRKNINKRVYGLMIQKICSSTRNSLDSIFLSAFIGLSTVAIYSNYYTIMSSITAILAIMTVSMTASIGNSIATESVKKNYRDMIKFDFMYMWISGWCSVCLICLYQPFMRLWMGDSMLFPFPTVICLVVYFYALKMGDIKSAYYGATGLWYEGRFRALAETILNIILNYFLGKYFGVNGIILATLISLLLINFGYGSTIIFNNYFKGISIKSYYLRHLLYIFITVLASGITYGICSLISLSNIFELVIKGIICIIIPNMVYLLCYFKYDVFTDAIKLIKNILSRRKHNAQTE